MRDVVFFINDSNREHMYVDFGLLDYKSELSETYHISKLKAIETRLVNGIPFNDFKSETEFKRLPKNWIYNTPLFEITEDDKLKQEVIARCRNRSLKDKNDLQWMYENGFLIEVQDVEPIIEAEFDHGYYRVVKKYPHWTTVYGSHNNIVADIVFDSYEAAQREIEKIKNERHIKYTLITWIERFEDIENFILDRYERDYGGVDLLKVKSKLLGLPRVYDMIFRYYNGKILYQYRNQNNNEWNELTIE